MLPTYMAHVQTYKSGSVNLATDVILTDGCFLDVRPIRVCFPSGLKGRPHIPVLDVFLYGQQAAGKSKRPKQRAIAIATKSVERTAFPKKPRSRRPTEGLPKANRAARRFCIFGALRAPVDLPKSAPKASVQSMCVSVKTDRDPYCALII